MRPGSVIIDLAAEAGGNCELTEPGKEVVKHGVLIIGHTNLPATRGSKGPPRLPPPPPPPPRYTVNPERATADECPPR